ncbi:MAG: HAMP domain-containing histidine kinase [Deltaproteobacteria bacterium]|nr:HAMP domain-containing histidine kinase [Deltaproteobacteria bacterium]
MSYKWDIIGDAGFQFLGKMNASISHEIKNVLAILNEDAGLLKDYFIMADKGKPIDTERQKTLAGKIIEQIRRADVIVRNMNRLAHSVDQPVLKVDLCEILHFMADLSRRFASMKGVTLKITPPKSQVMIATNTFFLENLIWLCLDFSMNVSGEEKSVGLVSEATEENGAKIRFTRLETLTGTDTGMFPGERERALLDALMGELETDVEAKEIVITLPREIGH